MFRKRRFRRSTMSPMQPRPEEMPPLPTARIEKPAEKPAEPPIDPARVADIVAPRSGRAGEAKRSHGRRLVVGRDISLTGEIASCETLVIEGRVDGEVTETQRLEISESGGFTGSALVRDCMVAGHFDGKLTVTGLLSVRPGGRVNGRIRYGEVEIARGGLLTGEVEQSNTPELPAPPKASKNPKAKAKSKGKAKEPVLEPSAEN